VNVVSLDLCNCTQNDVEVAFHGVGPVDVIVCSAGDSGQPEVFEKLTAESCEGMMQLNVVGVMKAIRGVLPGMRTQGGGAVCMIGSMAGQAGVYGLSAYCASKYALRGFAESLLMELKPAGIHVALVQPPDTDTPMLERESLTKPTITKEISGDTGVWSAESIAAGTLDGISAGDFIIGFGMDGLMLNTVTSGMAPAGSPLAVVVEILCLPLFRLIAMWYANWFDRVVRRHSSTPAANGQVLLE